MAIFAKKARGKMANYIIRKRIENVQDIKKFNLDGYQFTKELSIENEWTFIRNS